MLRLAAASAVTLPASGDCSPGARRLSAPPAAAQWMLADREDGAEVGVRAAPPGMGVREAAGLPVTHALRSGDLVRVLEFPPAGDWVRVLVRRRGGPHSRDVEELECFVDREDVKIGTQRRVHASSPQPALVRPLHGTEAARAAPVVLWALRRACRDLPALPVRVLDFAGHVGPAAAWWHQARRSSLPTPLGITPAREPTTASGPARSFQPRISGESRPVLESLVAETYEHQRCYPGKGWSTTLLPGDSPHWATARGVPLRRDRVEIPGDCTWRGGWFVCDSRGDSEGWQYSLGFSEAWSWYSRRPWFACVRRRRWCRVYTRPVSRPQSPIASPAAGAWFRKSSLTEPAADGINTDYFPGALRRPVTNFGPFQNLCELLLSEEHGIRPRTGFTGRQAVDWLVRNWRFVLDHSSQGSSPPVSPRPIMRPDSCYSSIISPRTPRRAQGEPRRPSRQSVRTSLRDSAAPAGAPAEDLATRRRDAVQVFEALRLRGIISARDMRFAARSAVRPQFRDDNAVVCDFKGVTIDPDEENKPIVETLWRDLKYLSDVTFDTESAWFRHVTVSVVREVGAIEEFVSRHRHRWKDQSHECFNCGDFLVEDSVVLLLCGHTLCTPCCKRFEREAASYLEKCGTAELLADILHGLLVCPCCHAPSEIECQEPQPPPPHAASQRLCSVFHSIGFRQTRRNRPFVFRVETVFENQRRGPMTQFSATRLLPSDRTPYGNEDGSQASSDPTSVSLPDAEWQWGEPWRFSHRHGCTDDEGWQYAFNWPSEPAWDSPKWSPTPGMLKFVRRRRWQRLALNAPATVWIREQIERKQRPQVGPALRVSLGQRQPRSPSAAGPLRRSLGS
eukprot:TRINITY_DN35093_c0_g1_i1.p1 TRINITY_DN35093_c0_g1~~TRINITY_DN35093_c0_g1_i1.p1  ORF type:complete len:913 (+),score=229.71 TRINITY_DN35093_c0_g1_i1:193-2739(+)